VVQAGSGTGSTTQLTVNGSAAPPAINFGVAKGMLPPQAANFAVTVTGSAPGDQVVLLDGNRQIGPVLLLNNSGQANYSSQLPVGSYSIQAFYLGSGTAAGSSSTPVVVNRSPRPLPR
jgi:hypothetical protein